MDNPQTLIYKNLQVFVSLVSLSCGSVDLKQALKILIFVFLDTLRFLHTVFRRPKVDLALHSILLKYF